MFVKSYCLFGDHGSSVRLQVIFPSNCNEFRLSAFSSKGFEMGGGGGGGGGGQKCIKSGTLCILCLCALSLWNICV